MAISPSGCPVFPSSITPVTTQRPWSNGICSVSGDLATCALIPCCPCIVYGQNKRRYRRLERHGSPNSEASASCGGGACWVHCLLTSLTGCGWALQVSRHGVIRWLYRIRGSILHDCCVSFWCNPCALTQESMELELEEKGVLVRAAHGSNSS
ncbi:PLAC8 family-domain-containing protein [Schizophyllum fasciatum]